MAIVEDRFSRFVRLLRPTKSYLRRANRERDAKHYSEAGKLYERALRDAPDARIHVQAGHMFKEAGDVVAAERHYLYATVLDPTDPDAHLHIAHLYKNMGRLAEAYAHFQWLADFDPDAPRNELEHVGRRLSLGTGDRDIATDAPRLRAEDVLASGLFDPDWYRQSYADIGAADPFDHFWNYGRFELRWPGAGFDPHWYLRNYPHVVRSGLDPFEHYLTIGLGQGLRPIGPAAYPRWIDDYDTLDTSDHAAIRAHIADAGFVGPTVVLSVTQDSAIGIEHAVRALRAQILAPAIVYVCLATDLASSVARAMFALVGSDPGFRIVDANRPLDEDHGEAPVVLLDAAIELRAHALYMLVRAGGTGLGLVYADHDRMGEDGRRRDPVFKPGPSPQLLVQENYLGGCALFSESATLPTVMADLVAGRTVEDLIWRKGRCKPRTGLVHVPFILYHDHIGRAAPPSGPGLRLSDADLPTVTIIIPTRDRLDLLQPCIDSLWRETDYPPDRIEIVVVDNGSVEDETIDWLTAEGVAGRIRTIHAPMPFNYPRLNNLAAETSTADVLVLLNNDTEVQDADWLRGLVGYAMLPDVGAVGPKLLYDDGTIQHAGVVLGVGGVAAHAHCGIGYDAPGPLGFAQRTREVAAVTGACLAMRRSVFEEIGRLDEKLPVAFNDVLLCLAALTHGYRNLYVHDVWVRHYESKTRGRDDTVAKVKIFNREARYARETYPDLFRDDPWYSPNLSFSLDELYQPAFPPRILPPWRPYKRRRPPRALLLSAALDAETEIGCTVAMQARFLKDRGYDVTVGAPFSALREAPPSDASAMSLVRGRDAAAYAVAWDADVIVAHTPGFGDVSRWLGPQPPVLLHYHGESCEAIEGVEHEIFPKEERLLALPFVTRIAATSPEAARELAVQDAIICPPGADRIGFWDHDVMMLRDRVRGDRGWDGKVVVLVPFPTGTVDARRRQEMELLISQFDAIKVMLVLWTASQSPATNLPAGMIAVAPRTPAQRRQILCAADVILGAVRDLPPLDALEAEALGLLVFDPRTAISEATIRDVVRALADAADAAGIPDKWARRAGNVPGWSEVLRLFANTLVELRKSDGDPIARSAGIVSPRSLIIESGVFDLKEYYARNSDLKEIDGAEHFLDHGHKEGRPFSKLFDTEWYIKNYPDAGQAQGGPLLDYLSHPEGRRDPNPFFSNAAYRAALGDQGLQGRAPLVHYLQAGAAAGLSVGPAFDAAYYCSIYPDVVSSGLTPLAHILTIGNSEGRLPKRVSCEAIDLFDDEAVVRITGLPASKCIVPATDATDIHGKTSAARFCITLMRVRPDLRLRFPKAFGDDGTGAFSRWLQEEGGTELGLSDRARAYLAALFASDPAARVRQVRLTSAKVGQDHPFAMIPTGAGDFLTWALVAGADKTGFSREAIWWFLLAVAESPEQGLVDTYLFTPSWQRLFPDGATVFGRDALATWLRDSFDLDEAWCDAAHWPEPFPPAQQIRIAYNARPDWRSAHPNAFATYSNATSFLTWLASPASELTDSAAVWLAGHEMAALAEVLVKPGLNMLGHFCYASGLRTSTEALVEGYRRTGGGVAQRDVWVQERGDDNRHVDYADLEIYDVTIIHTQPEPLFDVAYERAGLMPRHPRTYRIGYWYWELETIPPHWQMQADEVDEIWTATKFVGDALRDRFDVPVRVIMPGLEHPSFAPLPRARFGLPEGTFLFLFTFHMASIMERKNPLGLIEAFIAAFGDDKGVGLVLKTSFGHLYPEQLAELRDAGAGYNVIIIDDVYEQVEVLALMDACDSYISLHRSEGFGLTMAEAMLLGKPVIATNYSGNLEFMTYDNSLLVEYDLVTLDRDFPPYKAGMKWARASTRHAAECMRKVRDNPVWAEQLGKRAKEDLLERMSLEASGRKIAERLGEIAELRAVRASASARAGRI